jgi:hypothetical protein
VAGVPGTPESRPPGLPGLPGAPATPVLSRHAGQTAIIPTIADTTIHRAAGSGLRTSWLIAQAPINHTHQTITAPRADHPLAPRPALSCRVLWAIGRSRPLKNFYFVKDKMPRVCAWV